MTATRDDGVEVPITHRFDEFGDETDDWAETDRFVCGSGDVWFAYPIEHFESAKLN